MTLTRSCSASLAMLLASTVAFAQEQPRIDQNSDGDPRRVLYTLQIKGKKDAPVRITVPRHGLVGGAERLTASACPAVGTPSIEHDAFVWKCTMSGDITELAVAVSGPQKETTFVSSSTMRIEVSGVETVHKDLSGLAAAESAYFQAVFGGGLAFLRDDPEEFTTRNGTLLLVNDSEKRPTLLAGTLLRVGSLRRRQVSLHTALQFTQGGQTFLDGVSFGLGYELNRFAHVSGGLLLRKGKELSPGFKRAVSTAIQTASAGSPYLAFRDYDADSKDEALLDGLPLFTDADKKVPLFPGDAIIDSYNWSLYVGVTVPVRLSELLGGKAAAKD